MKKNDFMFLLIAIFVLVFAWIIFNIYHMTVSSTMSESQVVQIIPINPDFDTSTIEKLKKRSKVIPILEAPSNPLETPISKQISIFPTINPSLLATQGANQGTEGGTLK